MKPVIYDPQLQAFVAEILEATTNGGCTMKEARIFLGMSKPQIEHTVKTGEFTKAQHGLVMDRMIADRARKVA